MIKLQNLTPVVYYDQSRDFQFIGRLYDLVLNYIKTNAANLYNLPSGKNMDEQLLNLLALTLGFKPKKNYNSKKQIFKDEKTFDFGCCSSRCKHRISTEGRTYQLTGYRCGNAWV